MPALRNVQSDIPATLEGQRAYYAELAARLKAKEISERKAGEAAERKARAQAERLVNKRRVLRNALKRAKRSKKSAAWRDSKRQRKSYLKLVSDKKKLTLETRKEYQNNLQLWKDVNASAKAIKKLLTETQAHYDSRVITARTLGMAEGMNQGFKDGYRVRSEELAREIIKEERRTPEVHAPIFSQGETR